MATTKKSTKKPASTEPEAPIQTFEIERHVTLRNKNGQVCRFEPNGDSWHAPGRMVITPSPSDPNKPRTVTFLVQDHHGNAMEITVFTADVSEAMNELEV